MSGDGPAVVVRFLCMVMINEDHINIPAITSRFCLPVSAAENLCKQFGPRSGPANRRA